MKDRGHGSYRKQVIHMKGPGRVGKEPKRVSLDAGGMRKQGGGGTIARGDAGGPSWGAGKGKTGSRKGFGEAVGNRKSPGRRAPKGSSHNGFAEPH